jgi:ketopantoate reductase
LREKTLKHELDSMIWFVVKKAKNHGISVPLTERIFDNIKALERL